VPDGKKNEETTCTSATRLTRAWFFFGGTADVYFYGCVCVCLWHARRVLNFCLLGQDTSASSVKRWVHIYVFVCNSRSVFV